MKRGNIAAVCYLNTIPFVFGIDRASKWQHENLLLDIPANCTKNFIENRADIALIPSADLKKIDSYKIISDYCIGSNDFVRTVVMFSDYPTNDIETIYLDSHSHTSVELIKIISKEKWNISPEYVELTNYDSIKNSDEKCGYLLIGDKVFLNEGKFKYSYDLAHEWNDLTSLPFVFAVWVAKENVSDDIISELNNALKFGVTNINEAIELSLSNISKESASDYLQNNISFIFDSKKRVALNRFLQKIPPSSPV